MTDYLTTFLLTTGIGQGTAQAIAYAVLFCAILVAAALATWIVRAILLRTIIPFIQRNNYTWDDALIHNRFFYKVSWFVPVVILHLAQDTMLPSDTAASIFLRRLILAAFVVVSVQCVISLLRSIDDIYRMSRKPGSAPIRGYIDAAKIITYVFGAIFIIAVLTNRSPWGLLSVLGGLTAVTMLVFKDTILGFVASIQLSGTDMVRIGDWIEMPSHGADGDVIDVSIHCVRVQNWDKTITTIPTYALVSNPFKNWRGMSESGGRRIKRAINIDMNCIRFVSDQELEELSRISLITEYVRNKQDEIERSNRERNVDTSIPVNGRRQTNIGIFRAYTIAYLRNHPKIHQQMTFLVRQLKPTPQGLPLEIYVFSADTAWVNYEAIQADIFDHLLAALPIFGLRAYQEPSGHDLRSLGKKEHLPLQSS
ncbi:MAG: mechanosensitive ion channel [Desulfobulbaceae bacterium]